MSERARVSFCFVFRQWLLSGSFSVSIFVVNTLGFVSGLLEFVVVRFCEMPAQTFFISFPLLPSFEAKAKRPNHMHITQRSSFLSLFRHQTAENEFLEGVDTRSRYRERTYDWHSISLRRPEGIIEQSLEGSASLYQSRNHRHWSRIGLERATQGYETHTTQLWRPRDQKQKRLERSDKGSGSESCTFLHPLQPYYNTTEQT